MKRFVSLLLALSMAVSFSVTAATSVFAAGDDPDAEGLVRFSEVNVDFITITPDKEQFCVGDEITYTFRSSGKMIKSMGILITDLSGFEFASGKWVKSTLTIEGEDDEIVPILMQSMKKNDDRVGAASVAYAGEIGEQYIEGDMFVLKLKVLDSDLYAVKLDLSYSGNDDTVHTVSDITLTGEREKEPEEILGDFTGDGEVTSDDAIYLLRYTLFPEKFPVSGFADFTGDGEATSDDAIYLLRHTLFPEKFPLNKPVSEPEPTPDEYFDFNLLDDGTYEIIAKDVNNMPSDVVIPSKYDGKPVTSIGDGAFESCESLVSVTIPDSVTNIGWDAFICCRSLTGITIPDSVTNIGGEAFSGCESLISITLSDNVTVIDWNTFSCCSSLVSINIPGGVTNICDYAFEGCTNLSGIVIPESVTNIGIEAFHACEGLADNDGFVIVNGILFDYFGGNVADIPDTVTKIDSRAFYACSGLTGVTIPDTVTSIGDSAFCGCNSLVSVTVPGGITYIDQCTFKICSSLARVTIPDSVTGIGFQAFCNCGSLAEISFMGTKAQWNDIYKSDDWDLETGSYVVHCTDGDIEK